MENIVDILNNVEEPKTGPSTSILDKSVTNDLNHTDESNNSVATLLNTPTYGEALMINDIIKTSDIGKFIEDDEVKKLKDKLRKKGGYGYTPDTIEELRYLLSKEQGFFEKSAKGLGKFANEAVLGTVAMIGMFADMAENAYKDDVFYQERGAGKKTRELKEYIDDALDIYTTENHLSLDWGYLMNNMGNLASSISLMIPGYGGAKVAGMLGKRLLKGARASANLLGKAGKAGRIMQKAAQPLYNTRLLNTTGTVFSAGVNATISRLGENYQEAQEVYSNLVKDINTKINSSDYDYNAFLERNADILAEAQEEAAREGKTFDINNKLDVAKYIAKKSADRTFAIDWINVLFDTAELLAIGNPFRPKGSHHLSWEKAARKQSRYLGKSEEEIAQLMSNRTAKEKFKDFMANATYLAKTEGVNALGESVEEMINTIANKEGYHFAKLITDGEDYSNFGDRLHSYFNDDEIWDSAFWGFMGGIMFSGGTKVAGRVYNSIKNKTKTEENIPENAKKQKSWHIFDELPEIKRQQAIIEDVGKRANLYRMQQTAILSNENLTQEEKEEQLNQAKTNFIEETILSGVDSGCSDYMEAIFEDTAVENAMVQLGIADPNTVSSERQEILSKMREMKNDYYNELNKVFQIASGFGLDNDIEVPATYIHLAAKHNMAVNRKLNVLNSKLTDTENKIAKLNTNSNINSQEDEFLALQAKTERIYELNERLKELSPNDETDILSVDRRNAIKKELEYLKNSLNDSEYLYTLGYLLRYDTNTRNNIFKGLFDSTEGLTSVDIKQRKDSLLEHKSALDILNFGDRYKKYVDMLAPVTIKNSKNSEGNVISTKNIPETVKQLNEIKRKYNDLFSDINVSSKTKNPALFEQKQLREYIKLTIASTRNDKIEDLESLSEVMTEYNYLNHKAGTKALTEARKNIGIWYANDPINTIKALDAVAEGRTPNLEFLKPNERDIFDDTVNIIRLSDKTNKTLGQTLKQVIKEQIQDDYKNAVINREISKLEQAEKEEKNQKNPSQNENSSATQSNSSQSNLSTNELNSNVEEQSSVNANATQQSTQPQQQNGQTDSSSTTEQTPINLPTSDTLKLTDTTNPHKLIDTDTDYQYEVEFLNKDYDLDYFEDNGVNLLQEVDCVWRPIVKYNPNTKKFNIVRKGKLINVGSISNDSQTSEEEQEGVSGVVPKDVEPIVAETTDSKPDDDYRTLTDAEKISKNFMTKYKEEKDTKDLQQIIDEFVVEQTKGLKDEELKSTEDAIRETLNSFKELREMVGKPIPDAVSEYIDKYSDIRESDESRSDALKALIDAYCLDRHIGKLDGKYMVNFEHLCNYITEKLNGLDTYSEIVYNSAVKYINGLPEEYVIVDKETLLTKTYSDAVLKKRFAVQNQVTGISVSFNDYLNSLPNEQEKQKALEAYNSIAVGDELKYTKTSDTKAEIKTKDGVTIATVSMPGIDSSTGDYLGNTDGWNNHIRLVGDSIISPFKDAIVNILTSSDASKKELKDCLFKLCYLKLNNNEYQKVVNQIINNKAYNDLKEFANNLDVENNGKLINGLTKIIGYCEFDYVLIDDVETQQIIDSLNDWFRKTFDTYNQEDKIINGDCKITVTKINTGSFISAVPRENLTDPATQLPTISKGIGSKHKGEMAITKSTNGGYIIAGEPFVEGATKANISLVRIKNRNGVNFYVPMYPSKLANVKSSAVLAYHKAVKNKIQSLLQAKKTKYDVTNTEEADNIYQELVEHITKAFDRNKHISLYNFITVNENKQNGSISITNTKTKDVIVFFKREASNPNQPSIKAQIGMSGQSLQTVFITDIYNKPSKDIKDKLDAIMDNATIDIDFYALQCNDEQKSIDNIPDSKNKGYLKFENGKFVLECDNVNHEYTSYNDFIISNDLGNVNTGLDSTKTSNFDISSDLYKRSSTIGLQISENVNVPTIKEPKATSKQKTTKPSPVEKSSRKKKATNKSELRNTIVDILTNSDNKAEELSNLLAGKEITEVLKKYNLLPSNIIYDESAVKGHNAKFSGKDKQIYVGDIWLDDIALKNPQEGIRKLVHEQLHAKFDSIENKESVIEEFSNIYKEFVDSIPSGNDTIGKYKKKFDEKSKQDRLEEFIVESLTSKEFANYLNSVTAKDVEGQTILEKLFDFISKVLGIKVNDKSLYYKELKTLATFEDSILTETVEGTNELKELPETPLNPSVYENEEQLRMIEEAMFLEKTNANYTDADEIFSDIIEDEYTQEMKDIKAKAIADGTFMKAPNGQPTNLNERQWIHVRTKAFKDWFGDWESINRFNLDNIDTSKVDIELVDKTWKNDASKVNKTARIYLKGQKEKGYFELVKDQEPFMYSVHFKTGDGNTGETYGSTKEERAILYKELINALPKGAQISTWGEISKGGITALNKIGSSMTKVGERQVKDREENNINIPIYQNGESNVSKVVDENGEPLVVYHQTSSKFDTFDINKTVNAANDLLTPYGIFTKPTSDDIFYNNSDIQLPVFINNKNIISFNDRNALFEYLKDNIKDYQRLLYVIDNIDTDDPFMIESINSIEYKEDVKNLITKHFKEKGFDGLHLKIDEGFSNGKSSITETYISFNPNQVKSATDNNGNYSNQEDNIYYSDIIEDDTITLQIGSSVDFVDRLPNSIRGRVKDKIDSFEYKILCK
ncbi:MAG: hypothetical protein MJ209_00190 [archaeon]|nr:hypothetical protein [archaeon]